jgi:hypothetical protein
VARALRGPGDLAGFADPPANIDLAPDICARLVAIGYGTRAAEGADDAYAVAVLAHETEHLVAPDSESVTECYGMQEIRRAARDLGQSPLAAAALAEVYWREDYPEKPDRYRTPDCRDGGPLDANRNSSVWP